MSMQVQQLNIFYARNLDGCHCSLAQQRLGQRCNASTRQINWSWVGCGGLLYFFAAAVRIEMVNRKRFMEATER